MAPNFPDRIVIDEVLPPVGKGALPHGKGAPMTSDVSRFLAKWLDDLLRVPGTRFKIGLDPILAFLPGIGDAVSSGAGLIIVLEAVRSGVSIPVLLRMGANMGINSVLDIVPGIGPVASAFFKSNSRNLYLLQRWQAGQTHAVRKSTLRLFFAFAFLLGCLLILWTMIALFTVWMLKEYVFAKS